MISNTTIIIQENMPLQENTWNNSLYYSINVNKKV